MPKSPCTALPTKRANCTENGCVEPEVGAHLLALLRRGVLASRLVDRIADVVEQRERDERHREHHDHALEQAAEDEGEHARKSSAQLMASHRKGKS